MSSQVDKCSPRNLKKLEKYLKSFVTKVPQIIVQSRCGEKRKVSSYNVSENDLFEIAVEDVPDIQAKTEEACVNIHPLKEFCLCVETLLKTADGDVLVLEAWNLQLVHSETYWDAKYKVYAHLETVISNLMMLLKSIICVTRSTPAFKLSLGQSGTTYVILYRIYPGELQIHQLGKNPQRHRIGEVHTPVGTVSVNVAFRSKAEMTFAPQNTEKENSFMVNSDYFNLDLSPKRTSSAPRMVKNRVLRNSTNAPCIGAFARCSDVADPTFPELAFLQKTILHPSRSCLNQNAEPTVDNSTMKDVNSNLSISSEAKREKDSCEHLSGSDVSDGSDFVLIDVVKKPPFAHCDPDTDLNTFYKECQCAPSLSSFINQPSLQEQVLDVTNQLEKFEISMLDFDNFVDSVCQVDSET